MAKSLRLHLTSLAIACAILGFPSAAAGQGSARAEFDRAARAWEAGDYVPALEACLAILDAPGGEELRASIALLTGERYLTVELTTDGRSVGLSATGRYAVYTGGRVGNVRLRVVALDPAPGDIAAVEGTGLVFAPDESEAAYLADGAPRHLALPSGATEAIDAPGLQVAAIAYGPEGGLYLTATPEGAASSDLYHLARREGGGFAAPVKMTEGDGAERDPVAIPSLDRLVYSIAAPAPARGGRGRGGARAGQANARRGGRQGRGGQRGGQRAGAQRGARRGGRGGGRGRGRGRRRGGAMTAVAVMDTGTGRARTFPATAATVSDDGSTLVLTRTEGDATQYWTMPLAGEAEPTLFFETEARVQGLDLSPGGGRIAIQMMPEFDWEVFVIPTAGGEARRVTEEIQHDLSPEFLTETTLVARKGESRHRRLHHYDLETGASQRLFHNNTIRTIAPQYEWVPSADGTKIAIVAERDGNTVTPDRGVYVVDLTREVTTEELRARIEASLSAERDLRARGAAMFRPIAEDVTDAVARVSRDRLYQYQADLFEFGSKHVTQPGNAQAIEYIEAAYRSFGYEPELQTFDARGSATANIIVTLPGTLHPELVYVISSHFDSVARGPGADDDTSGTSVLLEAARALQGRPQSATIVFASFTGEESGLLGSREWVRRAVESGMKVVGALNNDMIGWANSPRLDNTIRYSNPGIRDVQHAAAFLFSDLITYDALYYKSTDAAAYYEAYGDIVGGIGSYPVLGNPHYHQATDHLDTINQDLVRATCETTVATLMLLASSPSRLTGLEVTGRDGDAAEIAWTPSPESDIESYTVTWGPASNPAEHTMTVTAPRARLENAPLGSVASVRAVNTRNLTGWDWARVTIEDR